MDGIWNKDDFPLLCFLILLVLFAPFCLADASLTKQSLQAKSRWNKSKNVGSKIRATATLKEQRVWGWCMAWGKPELAMKYLSAVASPLMEDPPFSSRHQVPNCLDINIRTLGPGESLIYHWGYYWWTGLWWELESKSPPQLSWIQTRRSLPICILRNRSMAFSLVVV